jgi:hypothetical protein
MTVTSEQVWCALGEVFDPENGMSIVELGLVYSIDIHDEAVHGHDDAHHAGLPPPRLDHRLGAAGDQASTRSRNGRRPAHL